MAIGVVAGLLWGLRPGILRARAYHGPNQGIRLSMRNAMLTGVPVWLVTITLGWFYLAVIPVAARLGQSVTIMLDELANNLGLLGLALAVLLALWFGGQDVIRHWVLRLVLWRTSPMDLSFIRVLDFADQRSLLTRAAGGYKFIHPMVQAYFAKLLQKESDEDRQGL